MITIYSIKPQFQALLRPLVHLLAKWKITANQVTLFATLLSILVGLGIIFKHDQNDIFYIVPVFLFVRMALNAIDGMLAKEHNMKTKKGAMLNELTDVISDGALFFPFAFVNGFSPTLVVLFTFLAALTELGGVVAQVVIGVRRYDGPMGKSDRAFVFGLLALLVALGVRYEEWINYLLAVLCLLLCLTIYNRSFRSLRGNE